MLKLFAIITMFIDHFAVAFLNPESTEFLLCRCLGRVSMPIFAYMLASGYIHTRNYNKYLMRMLIMAIAAQVPFSMLAFPTYLTFENLFTMQGLQVLFFNLNIGFTFCIALIFLKMLDIRNRNYNTSKGYVVVQFIVGLILLNYSFMCDYGPYCIFIVFIFFLWQLAFKNNKYAPYVCTGLIFIFTLVFYHWSLIQWLAPLAIIPIMYIPHTRYKYDKWIFYVFYPLHLLILVLFMQF
ncbi:MAG: hypothetical protein ATN31_00065 [Candidatus Epulonipiscioides saccharophilum]|nr:MAG: hypothetical protein ATN31_00065 [Epulopiscium sp. AS2M-Bin001]